MPPQPFMYHPIKSSGMMPILLWNSGSARERGRAGKRERGQRESGKGVGTKGKGSQRERGRDLLRAFRPRERGRDLLRAFRPGNTRRYTLSLSVKYRLALIFMV